GQRTRKWKRQSTASSPTSSNAPGGQRDTSRRLTSWSRSGWARWTWRPWSPSSSVGGGSTRSWRPRPSPRCARSATWVAPTGRASAPRRRALPSRDVVRLSAPPRDVAIIGMACRFPGASTPQAFWDNLVRGVESVTFFSDEELLAAGEDADLLRHPHYV